MANKKEEVECRKLSEVSSEKNGAKIVFATDDFFGVAENLLKEKEPESKESRYTDFRPPKLMDGWVTRNKRKSGNDYVIIALAAQTQISHICIDTCLFINNFPRMFSIKGIKASIDKKLYQNRNSRLGEEASPDEYQCISSLHSEKWQVLIPMRILNPGYPDICKTCFDISTIQTFTHLRLDIYPDGGVARLRIYGVMKSMNNCIVLKSTENILSTDNAKCIFFTNAHYGHPDNITKSNKLKDKADGWETARNNDRSPLPKLRKKDLQIPGCEYAIFKLHSYDNIMFTAVIVDTQNYEGDIPYSIQIEGGDNRTSFPTKWRSILPFSKLDPDKARHRFEVQKTITVSHIKVAISPDGGLSRLRILGKRISTDSAGTSAQSV